MLVLLSALGLAAATPAPAPPPVVILGNEAERAQLERLLGRAPGDSLRREDESGGRYVSCIGAWRGNPAQTAACMRARMPRGGPPVVILNSYAGASGASGPDIACIGPGGAGRARLGGRGEAAALRGCLNRARRPAPPIRPTRVAVGHAHRFGPQDAPQARAAAARVLIIAVDHVGIPRGVTGTCLVQGRIDRAERGPRLVPGAEIGFGVPCSASILTAADRRVRMGELDQGSFARVWIGPRGELLDYERVR